MNGLLAANNSNLALLQAAQGKAELSASALKHERDLEKIEHSAKEFEAVFIAEMMKPMFEGIKTDDTFGGGKGEDVFRGMLLQEYGKIMSQTGSLGIADQVKSALIQMQAEIDSNHSQPSNP